MIKDGGTHNQPDQWQCTSCREDQNDVHIIEAEPMEHETSQQDVNAATAESLVETESRPERDSSNHNVQPKESSPAPNVRPEETIEPAKSASTIPSPLKNRCVLVMLTVGCADEFVPCRKPETWSVSDVADFIYATGFEKEAGIFREQEIDGKSLLLMKRGDVITGLNLPLGVALKLYSFINHLQIFKLVSQADCPQSHSC